MKHLFSAIFVLLFSCTVLFAQTGDNYKWWDPANAEFPVIEGRGWHTDLERTYDRLPSKAEKMVRPEVWRLSQNSAGEYIKFETNASEIIVRYAGSGNKSMDHMPATGVSGIDLYARDINNNWHWAKGTFSFGDTIVYKFTNIITAAPVKEFRLYLPLYNTPKWTSIGVSVNNTFTPLPVSKEQPLVLYGTSIMQGACASRPGLAWTNILGRKINRPVINLGFSGNGRLEQPLIDLMNETNAKLFVLDCQPNLTDIKTYSKQEIQQRILSSVKSLNTTHPGTPVLLVEHCCGLPGINLDTAMTKKYKWTSGILAEAFALLRNNGTKNIYMLSAKEIDFDMESTVDGTHPNDIGMMKYAEAYEKAIRKILTSKVGGNKIKKKR